MNKKRTPFTGKALLGFGFIAAATALSFVSLQSAVVAIAATILVALHGKADALIELSFGPLSAKLERGVSEAEQLVSKLRELAALQAKATLATAVRTGRFSDASDWQFLQLKTVEAALRDIGVSEEALKEIRSEFIRFTILDLGHSAMGGSRVPMHLGNEAVQEWKESHHGNAETLADRVEAFLHKWGVLTPERAQRIEDMRWITEHGEIRDREQYLRGQLAVEWEDS